MTATVFDATKKRKRPRAPVEVVSASAGFPLSQRPKRVKTESKPKPESKTKFLDWHRTAHEVRALGASAFVGKQRTNYKDEEYKKLTGRERKKQQVPLPIVRGIRKKAQQRQARAEQEAKEAGIVLPKQPKKNRRRDDSDARNHGPAPSIGYVKQGVLNVKKKR